MRLLPADKEVGWTRYLWLLYLFGVPINTYVRHAGSGEWAGTIAGMLVFLVLYFRGYWSSGRSLMGIIAGITAIGVVFSAFNPGACVYFIFAASFAGWGAEPGVAVGILVAIIAVIGIESVVLRLPVYFWAPAAIFSTMIGAVNIHFAQRRRHNKRLSMAQDEVERMAQVAERERIARDLHDVLGHTLSVIVLKSELASKLAESDPAGAVREIRDVEHISRDALAQVRATVQGYQSQSLGAEATQAAAALEAAGVAVQCDFQAATLPASHEGVLALALREAVTNVIRHARASKCSLLLRQSNGECRLEVQDDGCGRAAPEGVGLSGMRHRVEALGGHMQRETGDGTRLVITMPVGAA